MGSVLERLQKKLANKPSEPLSAVASAPRDGGSGRDDRHNLRADQRDVYPDQGSLRPDQRGSQVDQGNSRPDQRDPRVNQRVEPEEYKSSEVLPGSSSRMNDRRDVSRSRTHRSRRDSNSRSRSRHSHRHHRDRSYSRSHRSSSRHHRH